MRRIFCLMAVSVAVLLTACSDDDSFGTSPANVLTFSTDTVRFDTVFSNTPSSTRRFWVYNRGDRGIRLSSVSLEGMNQRGYRVNVDGTYLGQETGYRVLDLEVRRGDSILVFVEITSVWQSSDAPLPVDDDLVFALESGVRQRVHLSAWSWDAWQVHDLSVVKDTTLRSSMPIVVNGCISVGQGATLTVAEGTALYLHDGAMIDVYGTLVAHGVTFRGDRLDRMFSYLPYDRVSGQWGGIRFETTSADNELVDCDIHGSTFGVWCEPSDDSRRKLLLDRTVIHNTAGSGLTSVNANIEVRNCQLTNAADHCVNIYGGVASFDFCTLGQFYQFSVSGDALHFSNQISENELVPLNIVFSNSIVTGFADDVVTGIKADGAAFEYSFDHCLLRTDRVMTADSVRFTNMIWEDVADTIRSGRKNFVEINGDMLSYDFHLAASSLARNATAPTVPVDRDGNPRNGQTAMGCYEYREP